MCWFDPSLCFVATVGCLFCEYLCWIDLELIGKCSLCLSQVEEVASGTARFPWPMTKGRVQTKSKKISGRKKSDEEISVMDSVFHNPN